MPYLRCKTGFLAAGNMIIKTGQVVDVDDPVVTGRESLFEAIDGTVEKATRGPGEVRLMTGRSDAVLLRREAKPKGRKASKAVKAAKATNGDGAA